MLYNFFEKIRIKYLLTDGKKRIKNNTWVCKVLRTHRIPAESHLRVNAI